jgi:hypothetical protein
MSSSFERTRLSMSQRDRVLRVMGTPLALIRSRLSERDRRLTPNRWGVGPSEHGIVQKGTRVGDKAVVIKRKGRPMTVVAAGLRSTRENVGDKNVSLPSKRKRNRFEPEANECTPFVGDPLREVMPQLEFQYTKLMKRM